MGVLARDLRGAYPFKMARADCPNCEGSGWKVVERTIEGAGGKIYGHLLNKRTYPIPPWLHNNLERWGI